MKKDIKIPEVTNVFMAVVNEYNDVFKCNDWNAYIINDKEVDIEMVLIVSKGQDTVKKIETSTLRHKIALLPAKSFAKVELVQEAVLKLSNHFQVTFFEGNTMCEKRFVFEKGTVKESALRTIPLLQKRGILAK